MQPQPGMLGEEGAHLAKVEADAVAVHPLCLMDEVPGQAWACKLLPFLSVAALLQQSAICCIETETCKEQANAQSEEKQWLLEQL